MNFIINNILNLELPNISIFSSLPSGISKFTFRNKNTIGFLTVAAALAFTAKTFQSLSKKTQNGDIQPTRRVPPQSANNQSTKRLPPLLEEEKSLNDTIFESSSEDSLNGSTVQMLNWSPRNIAQNIALEKMWKNGNKAIVEHQKDPLSESAYLPPSKAMPSLDSLKNSPQINSLKFEHNFAERQGVRSAMEDAHLFQETDEGILAVICDGHGGAEIAKFATEYLKNNFDRVLKNNQGNVHAAFEVIIDKIEKEVEKNDKWRDMGSTLVMSYVDKNTNLVYTATLGDSEANIYRQDNSNLLSIALSCIRDWAHPKDAKRAGLVLKNPNIVKYWPLEKNPKNLRFPSFFYGVNVARALGDRGINLLAHQQFFTHLDGVSHKPKITVNKVRPGDVLILACDGLKDYVPEKEIIDILANLNQQSDAAQRLVDFAIDQRNSQDNVSVLAIYIK